MQKLHCFIVFWGTAVCCCQSYLLYVCAESTTKKPHNLQLINNVENIEEFATKAKERREMIVIITLWTCRSFLFMLYSCFYVLSLCLSFAQNFRECSWGMKSNNKTWSFLGERKGCIFYVERVGEYMNKSIFKSLLDTLYSWARKVI